MKLNKLSDMMLKALALTSVVSTSMIATSAFAAEEDMSAKKLNVLK